MAALDGSDGVTLDITGCAHLWGGEAGLVADVLARFTPAAPSVRYATACTPEGAQALARFGTAPAPDEEGAIRRLPVAALRLEPEVTLALRRAGLKTVGDLACRPRQPLAARFGAAAVMTLACVLGEAARPIRPRVHQPDLRFDRRFAEPLAATGAALAVIGTLAEEAATALEQRGMGGRRFAVRLYRTDGAMRDLAVETGLPSRDPATLLRLFRERIDALADPIDPGFGFDQIRLSVPRIEPLAPTQLVLEGGALSDDGLQALVDRLSTRLGRERVRRYTARDSHIPEQASLSLPAVEAAAPVAWRPIEAGEPPLRPLHLFDPPQRISVTAGVPEGPPRQFSWRRTLHEVTRYEGPERIAPEWWRRDDDGGLTRDYYRLEDARGRRFWVFRHGLYGHEARDPGWYLHGLFA
jgi:protein ImuB